MHLVAAKTRMSHPRVAFRFPQRYPLARVTAKTWISKSFQFHLSTLLTTHQYRTQCSTLNPY